MLRRDFNEHENTCELIFLTCSECNTIYTRREEASHTEKKCLEEQLRRVRQEFEKFKQDQVRIEARLNQTIKDLEKNFSVHKEEQEKIVELLTKALKDEQAKYTDQQPQPASITEDQSLSHETSSKLNIIEN